MKIWQLGVLLLVLSSLTLAQVTFKNQTVYTNWQEYNRTILEDWADLTYQRDWFKAGLRYEINHPPDPFIFPQDSLLKIYELTFRYLQFRYKKMNLTVGNYYEMFGRGLTLRTYEDRNLRVDTNLEGFKFNYLGRRVKFKAIGGRMRDKYNRRKNWLWGGDVEVKPFKNTHIGASYLTQNKSTLKSLWAVRFNYTRDLWDFYVETVRPSWYSAFSYYAALNLYFDKVAATLEIKDYNRMSFQNNYQTEYNAAPSLTREHEFSMLNRHPHALNQNDERGYQFEVTYTPSDPVQIVLNHSQTFTHAGERFFEEFYGELTHTVNERLEYHLAGAWTFDFTTNTDNITPILDGTYNVTERDQIHLSAQHQHTKNRTDLSEYDNELGLIEISHSPFVSFAVVGEYTNKYQLRNVQMKRHTWLYGMASFTFWNNQQLSLLYGSRREGFICVGGICRYEPEFQGFELKMNVRF